MVRWPGPMVARGAVRLVALALLILTLFPIIASTPRALAAGCAGDEQILVVPAEPRVGGQVIVMAVSRVAHEQVLLLGPGGPLLDVSRSPFGDRFIWQSTLVPERAGEQVFVFGVSAESAPLTTCADVRAIVAEADPSSQPPIEGQLAPASSEVQAAPASNDPPPGDASVLAETLNPYGRVAALPNRQDVVSEVPVVPPDTSIDAATGDAGTGDAVPDAPTPTRTPRPTRTPTRRTVSSNGNANDNQGENDNTSEPTPTRTPTPSSVPTATRTPTPTRTPRPDPTDTPVPLATEAVPPTATRTPRPDPTDTPEPAPTITRTPTPTRTPRPDPTDTPVPTATRTPRPDPTDTPVPTPTPTLEAPTITDWTPGSAFCGQSLTIRGQRFGKDRETVEGRVLIDGVRASIISWEMTRIEVTVPSSGEHAGNTRELLVVVAGKTARATTLRVTC